MIIILVLNIHTQLSSLQCHFLTVRVMIVDYAPVCTSEEKRKRERVFVAEIVAERKIPQPPTFFVILKEIKKKKCRYNVINKTRFYTRTRIKQTHEITSVDDAEEKKKPRECGSTNNQAAKERTRV